MVQKLRPVIGVVAYGIGVSAISLLPLLPVLPVVALLGFLCLILTAVIVAYSFWQCMPVVCLLAGGVVGMVYGHWLQSHQLATELEGRKVLVTGSVVDLPEIKESVSRFVFQGRINDCTEQVRLRLSWRSGPLIRTGQHWQLQVKLRRPHGFASPGTFDVESWAAREGVKATGYVIAGELLSQPDSLSIREQLRDWLIASSSSDNLGVFTALLLGDRSFISPSQRLLLNGTGTTHLVVISGLHIGLMVLLGYGLSLLLARAGWLPLNRLPLPGVAAVFSLLMALSYALLAGMGVPVQRALVMTLVAMAGPLAGLRPAPFTLLAVAFAVVVTGDPLAVTGVGFWYSFGAVGALMYGLSGRYGTRLQA